MSLCCCASPIIVACYVLLCESSYCSILNVVGEVMFMEVAVRAGD